MVHVQLFNSYRAAVRFAHSRMVNGKRVLIIRGPKGRWQVRSGK